MKYSAVVLCFYRFFFYFTQIYIESEEICTTSQLQENRQLIHFSFLLLFAVGRLVGTTQQLKLYLPIFSFDIIWASINWGTIQRP